MKSPQSFIFSGLNNSSSFSLPSQKCFSPLSIFIALLLTCSNGVKNHRVLLLGFLRALPLLVRVLSASPDFPAAGLAVVVSSSSISQLLLSDSCASEVGGGSQQGAGSVGAYPTCCDCIEDESYGTAQGSGGSRALQESLTVGKREKMAPGAPPTSGSVQKDSLKLYF